MKDIEFCYWLQGFFEISEDKKLNEKQVQIVKDHLALVFDKQTPDRSGFVVPGTGEIKLPNIGPLPNTIQIPNSDLPLPAWNPNQVICTSSEKPSFMEPRVQVYC